MNGSVIVFDDYWEPGVRDYTLMIDDLLEKKNVAITKSDVMLYVVKTGH